MAQSAAPASDVPWDASGRLYIFGDSQSDSGSGGKRGNPAFFDGRPSNGPLWWEYAYPNKNLAIDPFLNGLVGSTSDGINFAIGGGGVAGIPAPGGTILPGAKQQAARYVQLVSANTISVPTARDTFVIYTGGNDFAYAARTGTTPNVTQMLADIRGFSNNLTMLGAKRFIIVANDNPRNTPEQTAYFAGLRSLTRDLSAQGATVLYANFSLPLADMLQNTALYGLKDPVGICPADGYNIQTCPSNYFLYDGLHFTTNVHKVFGQYVAAAESNINYAAGTNAQFINSVYQVHRDTLDVMSSSAQKQTGKDFRIYGFTRYNSGHANGQGISGRADYSGYTIGLGAYVPMSEHFSAGVSGALYDGECNG